MPGLINVERVKMPVFCTKSKFRAEVPFESWTTHSSPAPGEDAECSQLGPTKASSAYSTCRISPTTDTWNWLGDASIAACTAVPATGTSGTGSAYPKSAKFRVGSTRQPEL